MAVPSLRPRAFWGSRHIKVRRRRRRQCHVKQNVKTSVALVTALLVLITSRKDVCE